VGLYKQKVDPVCINTKSYVGDPQEAIQRSLLIHTATPSVQYAFFCSSTPLCRISEGAVAEEEGEKKP